MHAAMKSRPKRSRRPKPPPPQWLRQPHAPTGVLDPGSGIEYSRVLNHRPMQFLNPPLEPQPSPAIHPRYLAESAEADDMGFDPAPGSFASHYTEQAFRDALDSSGDDSDSSALFSDDVEDPFERLKCKDDKPKMSVSESIRQIKIYPRPIFAPRLEDRLRPDELTHFHRHRGEFELDFWEWTEFWGNRRWPRPALAPNHSEEPSIWTERDRNFWYHPQTIASAMAFHAGEDMSQFGPGGEPRSPSATLSGYSSAVTVVLAPYSTRPQDQGSQDTSEASPERTSGRRYLAALGETPPGSRSTSPGVDRGKLGSTSEQPRPSEASSNDGSGDDSPKSHSMNDYTSRDADPDSISNVQDGAQATSDEDNAYLMRHGWDSQYSEEQLKQLATSFYMYFNDERHEKRPRSGSPLPNEDVMQVDWRMKDRLKTMFAILALCLNLGVDPPDILRTNPSSRLECWVDPNTATSPTGGSIAMEKIGKALEHQYQQLSLRTKYKFMGDPISDDMKRFTLNLRKSARNERLLFHYNGHGVPKPTPSGEIWVFNKDYTQYIPIALYDFQSWIAAPGIFVWDSNMAGMILKNFKTNLEKHEADQKAALQKDPNIEVRNWSDTIQLAACREDELLPQTPSAPADLFTCCLTTPIEIAVRHFIMQQPLPGRMTIDDASKIPGKAQERRTPVGELNWIFTAITDTIAWNVLPRPLFKRLFRQDLMIAALFRNFLLAQRVMRAYHCHPLSEPPLPDTHDHPLWESWDYAVDLCLLQLPLLTKAEEGKTTYQYKNSEFFAQQLTAFELYLQEDAYQRKEPEQLPIVLQVLLSQVHRLRALVLLARFLDHGPWAVHLALSIGIFPYVSKLLQSQALELKPPLIFIWTRILAVDQTAQNDLLKDNEYHYFLSILQPNAGLPVREVSEHRAMCAFVLAMFCRQNRVTQHAALNSDLMKNCLAHVSFRETDHPLLRQWSCLCLAMLWEDFMEAKWACIKSEAHLRLCEIVFDPVPEVRAAMLLAISTFLGTPENKGVVAEQENWVMTKLLPLADDASSLVRKQMTVLLSKFAQCYRVSFGLVIRTDVRPLLRKTLRKSRKRFVRLAKQVGLDRPTERDDTQALKPASVRDLSEVEEAQVFKKMAIPSRAEQEIIQAFKEAPVQSKVEQDRAGISSPERSVRFNDTIEADQMPSDQRRSDESTPSASQPASSGDENTRPGKSPLKGALKHTQTSFDTSAIPLDGSSFEPRPKRKPRSEDQYNVFIACWQQIRHLAFDPDEEVATNANAIIDYLTAAALVWSHPRHTKDGQQDAAPQKWLTKGRLISNLNKLQSFPKRKKRPAAVSSVLFRWPLGRTFSSAASKVDSRASSLKRQASKPSSIRSSRTVTPPSTPPSGSFSKTQSTTALSSTVASGLPSKLSQKPTTASTSALTAAIAKGQPQGPKSTVKNQPAKANTLRPRTKPSGTTSRPSSSHRSQTLTQPKAQPIVHPDTPRLQPSNPVQPAISQDLKPFQEVVVADDFFRTSRAYFTKPQMQRPEGEETGSREWRERRDYQARNEEILSLTQVMKDEAGSKAWDRPLGVLNNITQPTEAVFHQIVNWEKNILLNTFPTSDRLPCKVTALKMVNEDGHREGLLMTGANDGIVRLWGDYADRKKCVQKASFRAPNELQPFRKPNCKLVMDWIQSRGQILTLGENKEIAVFSAATEQYSHGIPLGTSSHGKCMTTDPLQGNIVAVGFGDGNIRIYDQRQASAKNVVNEWREHTAAVTNIYIQRGGQRELATATTDGWINTWDIRMRASLLDLRVAPEGISHMILHEHAPTFAVGTRGSIKIFNVATGHQLGVLKTINNKRVDPVPPVAVMAYHPHKMVMVAVAEQDTHAWLYTLR